MQSVLGTILDPAADKLLMTTLTITLSMKGLIPIPLAVIILGRDVLLSLSAFWIRYTSLPHPKTFKRYWDFSIPSAEVRPTYISKVNTALQLALMGFTTDYLFKLSSWLLQPQQPGAGFRTSSPRMLFVSYLIADPDSESAIHT
ncbi:hypothetical protein AX16_008128 [Volvariella volvacea WC 439]|nr:hypothetical protein AX16_008128 [Volvariella volvacea WC 439]